MPSVPSLAQPASHAYRSGVTLREHGPHRTRVRCPISRIPEQRASGIPDRRFGGAYAKRMPSRRRTRSTQECYGRTRRRAHEARRTAWRSQISGVVEVMVYETRTSARDVSRHRRHPVGRSRLMDMGRYLVEAHLREGRPVAELAAEHGVHPSWIYRLIARYRAEGDAGLIPRSRRPKTSPTALGDRGRERDRAVTQTTRRGRLRRRRPDDPLAPRPPSRRRAIGEHDHARAAPPRLRHPATAEAAEVVVHPVRGRPPQRVLAVRHDALDPRRRHRGRDRELHRRSQPALRRVASRCRSPERPTSRRSSPPRSNATAPPRRCSPTTAASTPRNIGAGKSSWRPSPKRSA